MKLQDWIRKKLSKQYYDLTERERGMLKGFQKKLKDGGYLSEAQYSVCSSIARRLG